MLVDLLAYTPAAGEKLAPDLGRLPETLAALERQTAIWCYRYLRRLSESLRFTLLYRELFPKHFAASQASPLHASVVQARIIGPDQTPRFSPRELEFFHRVGEELFPLRDEYYQTRGRYTATEWIPVMVDYFGFDVRHCRDLAHPGTFLLIATAHAVVDDQLWEHQLAKLGLSWAQHGPRCLKEAHAPGLYSLKYDLVQIYARMLDYHPAWRWLPEAWDYATARTGSIFLDLTEEIVLEERLDLPEWTVADLRGLADSWKRAARIKQHFYALTERIMDHPAEAQALLELIGRCHTLNGHEPIRDRWEMRNVTDPHAHMAFLDEQAEAAIDYQLHPPEHHVPPYLNITDLRDVEHAR